MTSVYADPQPVGLSKKAVHQFAEHVAKLLGYKPGGDLPPVVKAMGGKIGYKDFWDPSEGDSGSLVVEGEGDFTIYLAKDTTLERDRFTIAHEIGHYVLHFLWARKHDRPEIEKLKANRYGSGRTEWEANWFAADFLMNAAEFKKMWGKYDGDVFSIADHFRVSSTAARTRAQGLGLLKQD